MAVRIKIILCFVFLATCSAVAAGNLSAPSDSLSTDDTTRGLALQYQVEEIVITASHIPRHVLNSYSAATVLTRSEIERSGAQSLAEAVGSVSGTFVKDYGGSSGLKTISQRGLGAEHTLILINGMRVSSLQTGLTDMGMIPADEIDRIEVLRGGHSAEFGGDAVGGIVNIITRPALAPDHINVASSIGSFGLQEYRVDAGVAVGDFALRGAYQEEQSEGSFPFDFSNGAQTFRIARNNADAHIRTGRVGASLPCGEHGQLTSFFRVRTSNRGVPGPVVSRHTKGAARQDDVDDLAQLRFSTLMGEDFQVELGTQAHYTYNRYSDPHLTVGGRALDNYFKNAEFLVDTKLKKDFGDNSRFALGGEFATTGAEGNSIDHPVTRNQFGLFVGAEQTIPVDWGALDDVVISPALRFDRSTSAQTSFENWSPQLGAVMRFGGSRDIQFLLRGNLSKNFRIPTFNELYFSGGGGIGNPALDPEHSTGFDVGGNLVVTLLGKHELKATFYVIDTRGRIVWVAAGAGSVTPKNLRRVDARGVELSYSWRSSNDIFLFEANFTSASTVKTSSDYPGDPFVNKQLTYIPQEMMNLALHFSEPIESRFFRAIGAGVAVHVVGFRFTTEDNVNFLPSYHVIDANVRAGFQLIGVSLEAECSVVNLFNQSFQIFVGYPMPRRSYRITLGVTY